MHSCIPAQMEYYPTSPMLQNRTLIKKIIITNSWLVGTSTSVLNVILVKSTFYSNVKVKTSSSLSLLTSTLIIYICTFVDFLIKKRFDHDWMLKIPPSNCQQGNHGLEEINSHWFNLSFLVPCSFLFWFTPMHFHSKSTSNYDQFLAGAPAYCT